MVKDALVFMVVSLNDAWKVPCGHFFIDGLSGKERANLVKVCTQRLHDAGVRVTSLTCDGPSCHLSMLRELGFSIDLSNMEREKIHWQYLVDIHTLQDAEGLRLANKQKKMHIN